MGHQGPGADHLWREASATLTNLPPFELQEPVSSVTGKKSPALALQERKRSPKQKLQALGHFVTLDTAKPLKLSPVLSETMASRREACARWPQASYYS